MKPSKDPIGPRPTPVRVCATTRPIRVELMRFAEALEAKLSANDHKAHWSTVTLEHLLSRLVDEVEELAGALDADTGLVDEDIQSEACDVAAFAMFIWDVIEARKVLESGGGVVG